jgi:hypothetical protein
VAGSQPAAPFYYYKKTMSNIPDTITGKIKRIYHPEMEALHNEFVKRKKKRKKPPVQIILPPTASERVHTLVHTYIQELKNKKRKYD